MKGRKHSEEAKNKIKEKRKNQIFTEETREKMSRAKRVKREHGIQNAQLQKLMQKEVNL